MFTVLTYLKPTWLDHIIVLSLCTEKLNIEDFSDLYILLVNTLKIILLIFIEVDQIMFHTVFQIIENNKTHNKTIKIVNMKKNDKMGECTNKLWN